MYIHSCGANKFNPIYLSMANADVRILSCLNAISPACENKDSCAECMRCEYDITNDDNLEINKTREKWMRK
jgi:hypothetical protein